MAYITPDAVVELFEDISLDSSYENTLYFASTADKDNYFTNLYATKGLGRYNDLSYNREQRGYVRLGMTRATAINATYMRFKNTSFENKWFYAFVLDAEYINNGCTEIHFALDYVMTWMGTFNLAQCYIERQHTIHDGIGNNIAEEGLPIGDYITEGVTEIEDQYSPDSDVAIVILYADENGTGSFISNIYSGCNMKICKRTGTQSAKDVANDFLTDKLQNNLIDSIVGLYMIPEYMATLAENNPTTVPQYIKPVSKPYTDIAGYVPKNKKLFCYPYKYLEVDNARGSVQQFAYEFFNGLPDTTSTGNCQFQIYMSVANNCEMVCVPLNYNMYSTTQQTLRNYQKRLGASNFPECSFAIDSYRAYRAEKNASLDYKVNRSQEVGNVANGKSNLWKTVMNTLNNKYGEQESPTGLVPKGTDKTLETFKKIMGGLLTAVGTVGNFIHESGGIKGAINDIKDTYLVNNAEKRMPDMVQGEVTPDAMWGMGQLKYVAYQKCITKNYAMMIDDYFTMFGYAVRQIGVPNMNARPYFTYVKTVGCTVHGNMPSDHAKQIEQIFDKGVRFWKSVDNIGNYNLNNAPI